MEKSIRDQLDDAIKEAEEAIKKVLQNFHNKKGMVPRSLSFDAIDVMELGSKHGTDIQVSRVKLVANT